MNQSIDWQRDSARRSTAALLHRELRRDKQRAKSAGGRGTATRSRCPGLRRRFSLSCGAAEHERSSGLVCVLADFARSQLHRVLLLLSSHELRCVSLSSAPCSLKFSCKLANFCVPQQNPLGRRFSLAIAKPYPPGDHLLCTQLRSAWN